MKLYYFPIYIFLIGFVPQFIQAQNIEKPNFAISSHPITVDRISRDSSSLILELTLENQLPNGYFCAGKNIILEDIKTGKKTYLDHTVGIPVCPEMYHFKWVGEKIKFLFYFPKVDTVQRFVNLIEVCDDHCLSIKGLILDSTMNNLINNGLDAYSHNNLSVALQYFEKASQQYPDYPYGFLYGYRIKILLESKRTKEAKNLARRLKNSNLIDKNSILKQLEEQEHFTIE